ncbi:MAG: hypothetical protein FJ276_24265, partial [Planctomycetes bacterium]|nr:hypothetical protein [Planctomycetota bacterium]
MLIRIASAWCCVLGLAPLLASGTPATHGGEVASGTVPVGSPAEQELSLLSAETESLLGRLHTHTLQTQAADGESASLHKPPAGPGTTDSAAPAAARALLERLLPRHVHRFAFEVLPPDHGRDLFEIESQGG